jgi:phage terminase small subunit
MVNDTPICEPATTPEAPIETALLTYKQAKWVDAYIGPANGNATEAARIAGYSGDDNSLGRQGHLNTRNVKILAYIERRRAEISIVKQITPDKVLRDLDRVRLKAEAAGDHSSALRASELEGKWLAMFTDRHEVDDQTEKHELDVRRAAEARELARLRLSKAG